MAKAHQKLQELFKTTGNYHGTIIYEYFPRQKVNSVPRDATAFRRELVPNALIILAWDHKTGDRLEEARQLGSELANIILGVQSGITPSEALGYSNYGQYIYSPRRTIHRRLATFSDSGGTFLENGKVSARAIENAKRTFGENYPRLQGIKKRYDPDTIFNKWFPIMPA